jgi:hypothetical protein
VESERERARRVLIALRKLPPGVLEVAAGATTGANAALLTRVAKAMSAKDPEAAMLDELRGFKPADPPHELTQELVGAGLRLADPAPIRAKLDAVVALQQELAVRGDRLLVEALLDAPRLVPLLQSAVSLLGDDGAFGALKIAVAAVATVGDMVAAVGRGDLDIAHQAATLRREREALAAAAAKLAEIPSLLARALEQAQLANDPRVVSRLALVTAAVVDDRDAWTAALDRAIAARQLDDAQQAASHIMTTASAGFRFDEVAAAATRIRELAAQLGDRDAELGAVGNQALAAAQLGRAGDARALVDVARSLGDGGAREARAHLLAGQVAEKLGDEAGARIAFRKVTERARGGVEHELGWAALHLGRLEAKAGQTFRAAQDLELAREIAVALAQPSLLALAVAAQIEYAPDRAAAESVLSRAESIAAETRAELQRRLDVRWPTA